jgi:hypothetical protein
MEPSSSAAGIEAEEAGCGERVAVSGTGIDACSAEFLEFCEGCSARACKWFNRRRFGTSFCSSTSARHFLARAACSLASFAFTRYYFLSSIFWRYCALMTAR